jgi:shikimate dehydrogenase
MSGSEMTENESYLVGLIGADIGPSLSPALHEREADELGLRYVYRRIDIAALGLSAADTGDLVTAARRLGFSGLNVTHPCKQAVVEHLDALSEGAKALGAVNTVVFEGERAVGHNTDWPGFQESFARGLAGARTERAVLVGAGGAGAAVAHALLSLGVGRLTVLDAAPERAAALVTALRGRFGDERAAAAGTDRLGEALAGADGVVNATPAGMRGQASAAFPAELLHPRLWVADVVYRPLETELLRRARAIGCRTLDGGGMAVFQAARSLALFTGREPDAERMLRHFAALAPSAPGALR